MLELDPDAFNEFLYGIGQDCTWSRAYTCPCTNPETGSASPGCPRCSGKGRFWDKPIKTTVGIASQKVQQEWAKLGLWESGDAVAVIPENSPMYEIGQFDRVVMLNSTDFFSRVLRRGHVSERLLVSVEVVTRVFWLDDDGDIVDGAIPVVGEEGELSWPDGGDPPLGKQYTINGTRYSEYYCFGQFAQDRNEHRGARLPKRLILRKWDLMGR